MIAIDELPPHVQKNLTARGDCWVWTLSLMPCGYAQTSVAGNRWQVHRLTYTLLVGDIPPGLVLDHLCRNRACANPAHLEPVTIAENVRRGARATLTHCKRGHEFTPDNTLYWRPRPGGGMSRKCRACRRARYAEQKETTK